MSGMGNQIANSISPVQARGGGNRGGGRGSGTGNRTSSGAGGSSASSGGSDGSGNDRTQNLDAKCPNPKCNATHQAQYPDPKEKTCKGCAEKAWIQNEKKKYMDELVQKKTEEMIAQVKTKLCEDCQERCP